MSPGLLHVGAVFLSALLLFLIQPMMGKVLLPLFGGSAGVWTTVTLFFQVLLLGGYVYAWWLSRLAPKVQIAIHGTLLAGSGLLLPVAVPARVAGGAPEWRILMLLAVSIGLPYFLLSATSPLVQSWRATLDKTSRVYRLYAISNLASLAALLLYPIAVEPLLPVRRQLAIWSAVYAGFVLTMAFCAWQIRRNPVSEEPGESYVTRNDRLLWVALAACPSVLWLSMASLLSQNLAPVPLLWVLPLALYLLSMVLAFDGERWYQPRFFAVALPVCWLVMGYGLVRQEPGIGFKGHIAMFSIALFVCCLYCHTELAQRKPLRGGPASFYVHVALGGALGGVFVGVLAPRLFDQFLEFPIGVAGCVLLAMALLYGLAPRRIARLALVSTAALAVAAQMQDWQERTRLRRRNFYGSLQVSDVGAGDRALRVLASGAVQHGSQFAGAAEGRQGTAYYGVESGAARAIRCLNEKPAVRAALIGLGAGTLATYSRRGDLYRFYELNPEVIALARDEFRYLREASGKVEVVEGDGRLALAAEQGAPYDLIVLDAFSGDSIPAHLLTREAFAMYFARLAGDGIVAVHLTNRYVDLAGVASGPAMESGRKAMLLASPGDPESATQAAEWVVITSNRDAIREMQPVARPIAARPRIWTDDYSDIFGVLR